MILVSIFRNSEPYLDRYYEQTDLLRWALAETDQPLRRVMVEGDSEDSTWKVLKNNEAAGDTILKVEHGGPTYQSQDIPARWRQISLAANVAITAATRDNKDDEPVVWMESDLVWGAGTVLKLLAHLDTYPAVAPMSLQGARFYDVWGYAKDGRRFSPWPPFHPGLMHSHPMTQIDSAGSCTAFTAEAAKCVEFSMTDCIKGVGRSLYANGYSLWLDPSLAVRHP